MTIPRFGYNPRFGHFRIVEHLDGDRFKVLVTGENSYRLLRRSEISFRNGKRLPVASSESNGVTLEPETCRFPPDRGSDV